MRKSWIVLFSGLLITLVPGCSSNGSNGKPGGGGADSLSGGGSSFINPLMKKWSAEYYKDRGVQVDYASTGSTNGIQDMITRKIDFGCTDAPMTDEQLSKARAAGGEVLHLPLVIGGVVPIYNLKGVDKLQFTGQILADIYLGKIKKWNDTAIQKVNEGVQLPDLDILTVHRSDGSGTTDIFTDYLSKVSEEWRKGPGRGTLINWPEGGVGGAKNDGVAGQVQRTPGAIGYVELIYALDGKLRYGAVENREHKFVLATLESVTAAADNALADIPKDLRYSITDARGENSYPICGTTWAVLYVKQPLEKARALSAFFGWATGRQGQAMTTQLQYSALPQGLVDRVAQKLGELAK
jgi:phosphate transport system substrate-binding protein